MLFFKKKDKNKITLKRIEFVKKQREMIQKRIDKLNGYIDMLCPNISQQHTNFDGSSTIHNYGHHNYELYELLSNKILQLRTEMNEIDL